MNIVFTGGHAGTTALSVVEKVNEKAKDISISWIGVKNSTPGKSDKTIEYRIYPKYGIKFYSIFAGKIQTKFTKYTIPLLLKIPIGLIQSMIVLLKIRPKLILSFGGFASFPVVFCGWLLRIPIIIHEQTTVAGRANLVSIPFAKKILLSYKESQKYFPPEKSVVVGNPILSSIFSIKQHVMQHSPHTILVMGGSRGSEFINDEVVKIHSYLLDKYKVVHITGPKDFERLSTLNTSKYNIVSTVEPSVMGDLYKRSDLVICRSGANTVSELLHLQKKSILIPLPRTYLNEQTKNAEYLAKFGTAKVMLENEVNDKSLIHAIETMLKRKITVKTPDKTNPSDTILNILKNYIK